MLEVVVDDFGSANIVNQAILNALESNQIDRVSLMINLRHLNMEDWETLISKRTETALHLNLSEGPPVANTSLRICDAEGNFNHSARGILLKAFFEPEALYQIAREEFVQQIRIYLQEFDAPKIYINSHQHIHILPIVRTALVDAIQELKLKSVNVRIPRERVSHSLDLSYLKSFLRRGNFLKYCLMKSNVNSAEKLLKVIEKCETTSEFCGLLNSGFANSKLASKFVLNQLKENENDNQISSEILFHIAMEGSLYSYEPCSDRGTLARFYLSPERQHEIKVLQEIALLRESFQ